jgi:spore coat polysaccharide biosynthesis protein SpsF (cytidylyltransferase family)
MFPLGGEPVIRHVLRRALQIPGIDKVVLAIPDDPRSRPLMEEAWALNVTVSLGSEHDVLERYWKAAKGADVIMRITADCPLIDPAQCGRVLEALNGADYASNVYPRNCDKGHDCEVFTRRALDIAYHNAYIPYYREHVTPFMQRNLKTAVVEGVFDPEANYCLDTPEDYARILSLWG